MLVLLLSVITMIGLIWATMLFRQSSSWQMKFLSVMLGAMPLFQTVMFAMDIGILRSSAKGAIGSIADLLVNASFLFSLFLLDHASVEKARVKAVLRVVEPMTCPEPRRMLAFRFATLRILPGLFVRATRRISP